VEEVHPEWEGVEDNENVERFIRLDDRTWGLIDRLSEEWTSSLAIDSIYQMVRQWNFHKLVSVFVHHPDRFAQFAKEHGLTVDNWDEVELKDNPNTVTLISELNGLVFNTEQPFAIPEDTPTLPWEKDKDSNIEPPFDTDFFKGLKLN
jgi:hypothetical protein